MAGGIEFYKDFKNTVHILSRRYFYASAPHLAVVLVQKIVHKWESSVVCRANCTGGGDLKKGMNGKPSK